MGQISVGANTWFDFIDPNDITVQPADGLGYAKLLRGEVDPVHPNRLFWELCAVHEAAIIRRWLSVPVSETILATSKFDRIAEDLGSTNICNAGWDLTGVSANAFAAKATGTVPREVGNMQVLGHANRAMNCSLRAVPGPNGLPNGMVDMVMDCTAGAAGDIFRIDLAGGAGSLFKDNMPIGSEWKAGAWVGIYPGAPGVVDSYNFYLTANLDYPGNPAIDGFLGAGLTYVSERMDTPLRHAYEGPLYMERARVPASATAVNTSSMRFEAISAAAGTFQWVIRMPTLRRQRLPLIIFPT